ncbi:MAG: type III secretion inner membrane ring lipoprotein SctJ [Pirellulales bacterium]|nr:type III secretion inner membrane ring lipoprotein SctJ [Pirellulales bacterium]
MQTAHSTTPQLALALLLLTVAGCGHVNLYTNIGEKEANEMMAILQEHDIQCDKQSGDDGSWSVTVGPDSFAEAVEILSELGRPREKFVTMQDLFPQKGLVSSPAEQKIRLTYGREQALAKTISELPTVVSARVHLVLPDITALGKPLQPSSASVVVIHYPNTETENLTLLVKEIVIGGVPELKMDAISVKPVPADVSIFGPNGKNRYRYDSQAPQFATVLSVEVAQGSERKLQAVLVGAAGMFVIGLGLFVSSILKRMTKRMTKGLSRG